MCEGGRGEGEGGGGGGMTRNSEYVCILVLRSLYGASAGQAAMVWPVRPWSYRFYEKEKMASLGF